MGDYPPRVARGGATNGFSGASEPASMTPVEWAVIAIVALVVVALVVAVLDLDTLLELAELVD